MIYFVLLMFLTLLLGAFVQKNKANKNRKRIYLLVMFSLMVLLAGFRAESVGIDTFNYAEAYRTIEKLGMQGVEILDNKFEYGFLMYIFILSRIFSSPTVMFFLSSALICFAFGMVIYRHSNDVVLSTFIFIIWFYTSIFNGMRQYMALSIILFGFEMLFKRKPIKYFLLIIFATLFHSSALIFIVFLPFAIKKDGLSNTGVLILSGIGIASIFLFENVSQIFFRIFPRYARFLESEIYAAESDVTFFWIVSFTLCAILAYIQTKSQEQRYSFTQYDGKNEGVLAEKRIYLLLFIYSIVCMVLTSKMWIVSRINSYFRFTFCLILPESVDFLSSKFKLLSSDKKNLTPMCIKLILYVVFFAYGYYMISSDGNGLLPYKFFWQ